MLKNNNREGRATIRDVARLAGVSRATVTRAMDVARDLSIREETRRKVFEAATSLNYRPSLSARSLKSRRSQTVAMVFSEMASSRTGAGVLSLGLSDMLTAAFSLFQPVGYRVDPLFFSSRQEASSSLLSMYHAGYFDALLVPYPKPEIFPGYRPLAEAGCLVVVAQKPAEKFNIKPHPNLLFVRTPLSNDTLRCSLELVRQGRRHLVSTLPVGKKIRAHPELKGIRISEIHSGAPVEEILALRPKVDAILSYDEFVGWRFYKALREHGVEVPEQITIAGGADVRHIFKPLPVLMLYYAPGAMIVRLLARHLIGLLVERGELSRNTEIPPELSLKEGWLHLLSSEEFAKAAAEELRREKLLVEIEEAILTEAGESDSGDLTK